MAAGQQIMDGIADKDRARLEELGDEISVMRRQRAELQDKITTKLTAMLPFMKENQIASFKRGGYVFDHDQPGESVKCRKEPGKGDT